MGLLRGFVVIVISVVPRGNVGILCGGVGVDGHGKADGHMGPSLRVPGIKNGNNPTIFHFPFSISQFLN
jgi:hypothetical protein